MKLNSSLNVFNTDWEYQTSSRIDVKYKQEKNILGSIAVSKTNFRTKSTPKTKVSWNRPLRSREDSDSKS